MKIYCSKCTEMHNGMVKIEPILAPGYDIPTFFLLPLMRKINALSPNAQQEFAQACASATSIESLPTI